MESLKPTMFLISGSKAQRPRDVKTYQCANNVGVKNPILGKIYAKFYTVLSRKLVMSQFCVFLVAFFLHIFELYVTFLEFSLHYLGILGI